MKDQTKLECNHRYKVLAYKKYKRKYKYNLLYSTVQDRKYIITSMSAISTSQLSIIKSSF